MKKSPHRVVKAACAWRGECHDGLRTRRRRALARLAGLAGLASTSWLAACAPDPPLVLRIHPWIGYEALYLAREFGWLPAGVRIAEGKAASDSMAALEAGTADAACLTLDEVLRVRAAGTAVTVVLVFDVSAGADVVLARPSIRNLSDLAHKRIGVERGALGAVVLEKLLEAAALPLSAVTVVDLPMNQQVAAWRADQVDAIVSYEPTAALLRHEGARDLYDSRQIPDTIFDVLAVRGDLLQQRRAAIQGLVASHFRGLRHIRTNHEDAIYRIAAREGVSPDEVRRALAGVNLPSLAANRSYLAAGDSRLLRAARAISALMVRRGLLPREDSLAGLVTPALLPGDER